MSDSTIADQATICLTRTQERRDLTAALKAERAAGDFSRTKAIIDYMIDNKIAPIYRPSMRNTMQSDPDSISGGGPMTIADYVWLNQAWVEAYARERKANA